MKTITQNEYKFLKELEQEWTTQESDDGIVSGYVSEDTHNMIVIRGVIGSLVKKGIVSSTLKEHTMDECDVFLVVVNKEYGSNYKLTNIEVA